MFSQYDLKKLTIFDPKLAESIAGKLDSKRDCIDAAHIGVLEEESLWGLSQEISFGQAIADGFADLIGETSPERLHRYRKMVREAGRSGPTLGRILATALVPVFKYGTDSLTQRLPQVIDIMLAKGIYTLNDPLNALEMLLEAEAHESADIYLELLADAFSIPLTYSQCQFFAASLPRAVRTFAPTRRPWQLGQLRRVIRTDFQLVEPFLAGMEKGLYLLDQEALAHFVTLGLEKYRHNRHLARKFFALVSKTGSDTCSELQVAVALVHVRYHLNRYLQARTGMSISVADPSVSQPSFSKQSDKVPSHKLEDISANMIPYPGVYSDGKSIYLPEEIRFFKTREQNTRLYKILNALEASFYEFQTHHFDLDKALAQFDEPVDLETLAMRFDSHGGKLPAARARAHLNDLEKFLLVFPFEDLAFDLFTIFELARISRLLTGHYPGLVRMAFPLLKQEAVRLQKETHPHPFIFALYVALVLDMPGGEQNVTAPELQDLIKEFKNLFKRRINEHDGPETAAELVIETYPAVKSLCVARKDDKQRNVEYHPLQTAFNWRPWPNLFMAANPEYDRLAEKITLALAEKGLTVYKSVFKQRLYLKNGLISIEDIAELAGTDNFERSNIAALLASEDISAANPSYTAANADKVSWQKEWDCSLADYLQRHVRVLERTFTAPPNGFYRQVLQKHYNLIKRIRYAFEYLKPEGLTILRQWVEGDEFDYRSLLDFALDKKAGLTPSDRLYIKRVKTQRDVSVLLLVDLSRSTSSPVAGSRSTVLDVEKEAIVMFSEALEVMGDAYGIAGFSGTGRLGVDFEWIKHFDEPLNRRVRHRVDALASKRNTRMGAAIRHAIAQLEKQPSKVRLLIVLGDGFPNDVGYKQGYAIADTRQAIFEGSSKNIFVHAITVNIAADPKLDALYGNIHHNVISDIRELPDRLPKIYGALTKR